MQASTKKSVVRMGALGGGAALVLGGMAAYAAIPASNGTIYGCYANSNGATRIIDPGKQKCSSSEKPISWSQRGPEGPRGIQGKTGATGKNGKNGLDGAPGVSGLSGYEVVERVYEDSPLPMNGSYTADCPEGKLALGGGAHAQLYSPEGFVGSAPAARYSIPSVDGDGWITWFTQPAEDGATRATVTVTVACADAATAPVN